MNRQTFNVSLVNLFGYFQRKQPAKQTADLWFADVSFIPDEAVLDIEAVIRSNDSLPRNIPKAYRDGWRSWKANNPDKIVPTVKTKCQECGGGGFLWYKKDNYSQVCRCAKCDNWKRDCNAAVMPAYDRRQLIDNGATLER